MIRTAQHGPTGSVPASIHWTHSGHHNEDLTRRVEPRGAGKRRSQRAERWELRGKLSSGQDGDYQRERSSVTNRGCDKSEVVDAEASNEDGRWRVLRLHAVGHATDCCSVFDHLQFSQATTRARV